MEKEMEEKFKLIFQEKTQQEVEDEKLNYSDFYNSSEKRIFINIHFIFINRSIVLQKR